MVGAACRRRALRAGRLDILAAQAQLVAPQVVVERLHIGEDALGVGLLAHDHHVLHLHQRHAVHQHSVGRGHGGVWLSAPAPLPVATLYLEVFSLLVACWVFHKLQILD